MDMLGISPLENKNGSSLFHVGRPEDLIGIRCGFGCWQGANYGRNHKATKPRRTHKDERTKNDQGHKGDSSQITNRI